MIIEKTKMSSPTSTNSCQRFVRNAWKKDLCSNCFKPKEEHAPPPKVEINTLLTWELNDVPPLPSILKSTASKTCKGSGVTFNAEESEVIGYGGNDEFSDDDDEDDFFDENPKYEGEDLPDSEYEKELHKLTISNTDFNSVTENLNKDTTENTKPITPLKLGRPDLNQTPAKTVLVTVQPFGSGTTPNKINTKSSIVTSCGLSKTNSVTDGATITKVIPKTILGENVTKTSVNSKTNNTSVVSNSLLKEPGGSNKNSHDLSSLNKSDSQNKVAQSANVNIVNTISSEITSPPKILSWKTLGDQKTETHAQKTERSDIEMKTSAPEGKKPEIVIKFANNDNGANQVKRNNSGTSTESKSRKCLTRGSVITKSHEIVKSKIVQQNKGDLDDTLDSLVDVHDLAEENKTTHDNHVTNINIDSQVHEKTNNIFASKNTFLKKELCEKINDVINKNHQSKLDFMTKDMEPSNDWVTVDSVDCRSEVDGACPDSSLEDASIFTCDREKIGEPDGKADSDSSEHSEPPELPKIPPPYEVNTEIQAEAPPPRSSFLHKKPSSENLELKPKIGIKPNGLLFSIPQQFSSPTTKLNGFLNNSNKDIKINSLKIQSNYVELKKRSGDYDIVNFKTDDHYDNAEKLSTSSDESSKLYKEHEISSSNNSPETYKLIAEPDSMYYCKDSVRRPSDLNARTGDSTSLNNQKNSKYRTNQTKTVESGLSEMIDSKIIFDKEYENVVKSSCSSRLEPRDDVTDLPNNKVEVNAGKGKYSQGDHQTYANFNDAIDRLNGLEEKFNPIYNYSRSRSNSYDENFSDCVINRCETPLERTKRQAPKPPPTPPPSAIGKKPLPSPSSAKPVVYPKPDLDISPPPRKSSSTDCLTEKYPSDKMLKKMGSSTAATRMRHKFKKLLRIGKEDVEFGMVTSPAPRPRPQIIHPIDYNKPGVEVLRSAGQGMSNKENEIESSNGVPSSHQGKDSPGPTPPIKPQRTASLRDSKKMKSSPDDESKTNSDYTAKPCSDYDSRSGEFDGKPSADCASNDSGHGLSRSESDKTSNISEDHLYEVINRRNSDPPSPSDASSSDQRSLSYQYAGSETESDIYYPYVFYGNDEGSEEDGWKGARVRVRRSRNVVHKTLEDNYGAVVIANHEALAQMLEQMNQNFITPPPSLKSLKTSPIRFRDLTINEASKLTLGGRNFYTASYDGLSFAVALCGGPGLHNGKSLPPACVLSPVAEFIELIPSALVCSERTDSALQATVSILPCSYISSLHLHIQSSTSHKDLCLVLLQLVSAALSLAACGIEDTAAALDEFVVCGMEDKTSVPRLCVVPCADQPVSRISLCSCVRKAVSLLLPFSPLSPLLLDLLSAESSLCLSQVKSVLEFWLWGPEDLRENEDKQVALQRWLDLDRATCLHSLVCSRPPALSPPDYSHLSFLVRTNSKALSESDSLLSDIRSKQKEY